MKKILVLSICVCINFSAQAWEVDFSRREVDFKRVQNTNRMPTSVQSEEKYGLIESFVEPVTEGTKDIVVMNTDEGFVPSSIPIKKGGAYRLHVVNVNSKFKNSSFSLDEFSQHHSTLFGKVVVMDLNPKVDGVFKFHCPETGFKGQVVVIPSDRKPASR